MKNEYEVRGDITAIIINSPKYGRQEALISTSKLDQAKEFHSSWYVWWNKNTKSLYVAGMSSKGRKNRKVAYLHRWITKAPDDKVVDHINHNTLDNTDGNIRVVTNTENQQNRKGASANSKSGILGVHWEKRDKKWISKMQLNGKSITVGYFDDVHQAEQAIVEARMKYRTVSNIG